MSSIEIIEDEINNFNGSQEKIPTFKNLTDLLIEWTNGNITEFWHQSFEVDEQNLNFLRDLFAQLTEIWNDYKNGEDLNAGEIFKTKI